jgi:Fe-S-cluster-containing hydrogenase component 2
MVGTVIGRPYCRFLCPYGALLNLFSRVARRRVSITPDDCVICGLCENACPFDAIHEATEEEGTKP